MIHPKRDQKKTKPIKLQEELTRKPAFFFGVSTKTPDWLQNVHCCCDRVAIATCFEVFTEQTFGLRVLFNRHNPQSRGLSARETTSWRKSISQCKLKPIEELSRFRGWLAYLSSCNMWMIVQQRWQVCPPARRQAWQCFRKPSIG